MEENTKRKKGSIFELHGVPGFYEAFPLALQHVVAMIVGCVTPAIIVAGAAGLDDGDRVILIQAALAVSALSTFLQMFPIGKKGGLRLGSGLPVIMGVSFAYVASMQAIAEDFSIAAIFGAQIVGGVVAIIIGFFIDRIRRLFPPLVTGTVVFTIGLSLYPTAINYMAGGAASPDYGHWKNWLVAFLTLVIVTFLNHYTEGLLKLTSILLGMAGVDIPGYVALVREGRLEDAVRLIRKDNPLATDCAFICEHPCEARHRRNMLDQSVNIRGLKRYATDHAGDAPIPAPAQPTGKKVAVIGGGPGGISAAYYLSRMGHQVTIYEQRKRLGGMLRYGIPAYRLPREVLDKEIETLLSDGVEVKLGVRIGKEITIVKRMKNTEKSKLPLFTSCCPGWVRFLKSQYPKMTGHLSTAKSPQQMFGAVAKSYYSQLLGADPKKIFCLSVMPCLAKKRECALPTMNDAGAGPDVDASLTVREIDRMIRAERIDVSSRSEEAFDQPLGVGAGAAVIFGATGGAMEAALRSAYYLVTGENPHPDSFQKVRGLDGWKEAVFDLAGTPVRTAIVSGLGNARKLMEAIQKGAASYDFVEVMACPGGCAGGGGQPIHDGRERGDVLYSLDRENPLRFSHENPAVLACYADFFGKPLSEKAHALLHTDHDGWQMPEEGNDAL